MSVAIAAFSPALKEHTTPASHQPDLLESLLASCKKPAGLARYSGYGRELKPYFDSKNIAKTQTPTVAARNKASASERQNSRGAGVSTSSPGAKKIQDKSSPTPTKLSPKQIETIRASKLAAVMTSWAGPGFCVSPAPEKVPLPSSALLR